MGRARGGTQCSISHRPTAAVSSAETVRERERGRERGREGERVFSQLSPGCSETVKLVFVVV